MNLYIELLSASCECETCGTSWAEGAKVFLNGELILDLEPYAHCYEPTSHSPEEVYKKILEHLGYTIIEEYGST
jgi:hypothetical protein